MNDWLDQLEDFEVETLRKLLAKANPPPVLHRYRGESEWAIAEIAQHHIHVAKPEDMNDPFEHRAPLRLDHEKVRIAFEAYCRYALGLSGDGLARALAHPNEAMMEQLYQSIDRLRENSGIVCFSANPRSNRMWGYYASSHRGICISYDTSYHPFSLTFDVIYEDPKQALEIVETWLTDASQFCDHLARRKGKEWEFEQEYRLPIGQIPPHASRLLPVDPRSIVEVRLGVKMKAEFKDKVLHAISTLPHKPTVIQMCCDYENFTLTETMIESSFS
jgi:hypothetical protein